MATSRITGSNENISTYDSAGGKDYTSLATWESATDNDLVAATTSEVLECYGGPHDDGNVTLAGATANASYRRIIRNAAGLDVVFNYTHASNVNILSINEAQGVVQSATTGSLSFTRSGNSASSVRGIVIDGVAGFLIGIRVYNIANAGAGSGIGIQCLNAQSNSRIVNCVVYGCKSSGITGRNTMIIYDCTSVGNGGFGFTLATAGSILRNCLGSGNTSGDFDTGFSASSEYNASADATAPGTNSRTSQTFTFAGGGAPYQLAATDTGAKGFGKDLSADATFPFDDDIAGSTRSAPWDIGAWKAEAAAGGQPGSRRFGVVSRQSVAVGRPVEVGRKGVFIAEAA